MTIVFAGACAHAPGMTGWPEAARSDQANRFAESYRQMGAALQATQPDVIVMFTSEHWANFFLSNYPAFCIGRAETFSGPLESAINIPQGLVKGDRHFANELLERCYSAGFEPSFSDELTLDHGTMVPLHFLTPERQIPVVPIIINALAAPLPAPARCYEFGAVVGGVAARSGKRVALIASGGLSHHPGTPQAGTIDLEFDRRFLESFCSGKESALRAYTDADIHGAGFGAHEIRNWIALAGATSHERADILCYEPVPAWATGCALAVVRL